MSSAATRDPRIDPLYRADRLCAWLFVGALWLCLAFVLAAVWGVVDDAGVRATLAVAAGLLLLFNTASIGAMVRHAAEDRDFVYGLDLKHADELERWRREAAAGPAAAPATPRRA